MEGHEPTLYSFESFEEEEHSLMVSSMVSFVECRSCSLVGSKGPVNYTLVMKGCSLAISGVHLVSLSNLSRPFKKSRKASIVFNSLSEMKG